jgi:cell division protein FtsB
MVCHGLKTIDKLDAKEEKEKQKETEQAAQAAMLSSGLRLDALAPRARSDPFASLEVPLLLPKV